MSLYTVNRDAVLRDFLRKLRETGFERTDPASGIMLVCSPVIDSIISALTQTQELYNGNYLSTAKGESLDRIGDLVGLERLTPIKAFSATQRFYVPGGQTWAESGGVGTGVIPVNTLVYAPERPNLRFTTLEPAVFNPQTTEVSVAIEAVGAGSAYRAGAGTLTAHSYSSLQSKIWTSNRDTIDSGSDTEGDDNFRYRISTRLESLSSPTGLGIEARLLSVPGVRDVRVDSVTKGPGSITVTVLSKMSPTSPEVLRRVREECQRIVAGGIAFEVKSPMEVPVTVYMVAEPDDRGEGGVAFLERVKRSVSLLIANLGIEETLEVSDLINAAYQVGATDAAIVYIEVDGERREIQNLDPPKGARFVIGQVMVDRR